MSKLWHVFTGADTAEGDHPVDEVQQGAATSLRWLGVGFLLPLVSVLFLIELQSGTVDVALLAELVICVAGSVAMIALRHRPAQVAGTIGSIWLGAVLLAAQLHFGLTAGLAAGWMTLAIAGHIFRRWRGSLAATALQLVATLGLAAAIQAGVMTAGDFSRFGETEPAVLLRMGLVVASAMVAMALAQEALLGRLEHWQRSALESRDRLRTAQLEHARAVAAMENLQHLESVGRLASGVAHDVNNALTIVMGNAELMAWADADEMDELRQEILTASSNASRTTSQLMTIARGALRDVDEQPVGPLVESLTDLIRRILPSDIDLDVSVKCEREVNVDAVRFQQVLMHLIANARDAITRRGTVSITVVDTAGTDEGVSVTVADNGRGWDMDAVARAFDPADTLNPGQPHLGLATARDLTVRYGGTVEIQSTVGHGTRIVLHLGRQRRQPSDSPRTNEAIATQVDRLRPHLEPLRGRPILVAEDEEPVRRLMEAYLRDIGARLTVVTNAVEARAALLKEPYDLFITDAVMPGGGTMDAIEEFRRRNRRGTVLVVSGHIREDLIRRGIETGTVSFLPKPFNRVQLLEAVARSARRTGNTALTG